MAGWDAPLRNVVGAKTATVLADTLDLHTMADLLRHYPRRYAERGELTGLADLAVNEHVTVLAEVAKVSRRPMRNRRGQLLEVVVSDGRGSLTLTFFNQAWRERELRAGRRGLFAGKVGEFRGKRQLSHPDYQLLDDPDDSADGLPADPDSFAGALIPVYPATAQLPSWKLAGAVRIALDVLDPPPDPLPDELRTRHGLLPLADALRGIHRPAGRAELARSVERLKWDEALLLQVTLAQRRAAARETPTTARPPRSGGLREAFSARLPFDLTAGQREVGDAIDADLSLGTPMHRLLQGEVGSGKTVVALRAMLTVVDTGGQAALLAPTEVLAAQHARSMRELLGPLATAGQLGAADGATSVVLLTGSLPAAARRAALAAVADGSAGLVVGTHALLQEGVDFRDLGLIVVDEQHRFGVEQRDALRAKGERPPHVLVMTATPIPRTVAMTVYGDLEVSTLSELPAGRSPIRTFVVPAGDERWTARMWGRVRDEVAAGRQAFVVCARIGDAEGAEEGAVEPPPAGTADGPDETGASGAESGEEARRPAAAVLDVARSLAKDELAGLRVAMLHGRQPAEDKDRTMRAFAAGELDVLVATTVIEVGVDVPNATVMVVLDADRFGVSQLHQLRGRVGRGTAEGWCLLHTAGEPGTPARERLEGVAATLDGFALARLDLEQRREGDVLGAAQSGRRSSLRLLRLLPDEEVIRAARQEAVELVEADPRLERHPALAAAVAELVPEERAEYLEKG